jgi:hypothetical protein
MLMQSREFRAAGTRSFHATNLTLCSVVLSAAGSQGSLGRFLTHSGQTDSLPQLAGQYSAAARDGTALGQLVEQRLGVPEVFRVEAFGKPAVDRREQVVSLTATPLVAHQPRIADRGAELP